VKRNSVVLGVMLALLAFFVWAGWANWSSRKWKTVQPHSNAAASSHDAATQTSDSSSLMGKLAPDFALQDLNGQTVRLADFRGKALLINFWATWCGPCRIETPWLVELQNKHAAEGFAVIGISSEGEELKPEDKAGLARQRAAVQKFATKMKVNYPMLLGGDSLASAYGGLDAMPTSFYVDKSGKVVAVQMGMAPEPEMEENIRKALGK